MKILFWLTAASYIATAISSIVSRKYSDDPTASGEYKEKIISLATFILLLSGVTLTFIFGMIYQRYPYEVLFLVPFMMLTIIVLIWNDRT